MERRSTASPAELSWYPSNHAQPSDVCQSWTRITRNIIGWLNWTLADLVTRRTSPDLGNTVGPLPWPCTVPAIPGADLQRVGAGAPSVGRPLVVRQCRETRRPGQHPLLRVHLSPESSLTSSGGDTAVGAFRWPQRSSTTRSERHARWGSTVNYDRQRVTRGAQSACRSPENSASCKMNLPSDRFPSP